MSQRAAFVDFPNERQSTARCCVLHKGARGVQKRVGPNHLPVFPTLGRELTFHSVPGVCLSFSCLCQDIIANAMMDHNVRLGKEDPSIKPKMESLREKIPQGKDAFEAIKWLENNKDKAIYDMIVEKTLYVRHGTDCWGYAMCAGGTIDLVIEKDLEIWDIVAARAIIEAAGGIVTAWNKSEAASDRSVIAAANIETYNFFTEIIDKL